MSANPRLSHECIGHDGQRKVPAAVAQGFRVTGMVSDQTPGTESTIAGDVPKGSGNTITIGKKQ